MSDQERNALLEAELDEQTRSRQREIQEACARFDADASNHEGAKEASERIAALVEQYLQEHPGVHLPAEEYRHPSVLAMHRELYGWLVDECGGSLAYWALLLLAAKHWFPDRRRTKLGHIFCNRFEMQGNVWWEGLPEFEALGTEYARWRGFAK